MGNELTGLKRQYEQARLNAVRAQMAEVEMERRTGEVIDGALYLLQKPLNVIKAMSDNLKRQMRGNETATELPMGVALDEALTSGYAAMNTLRLSLPGNKPGALAPVNMNDAIRDVLVLSANRLSSSGIIIDWQPEPELPMVLGKEIELRILLRILLDNAILAVGQPGASGREVHIDTLPGPEGQIKVCIRDSGPGIEHELRAKIFEPFFTSWTGKTPDTGTGSGMGLTIARQITGELDGELYVDGSPQSGGVFCVSLPAYGHQKSSASA